MCQQSLQLREHIHDVVYTYREHAPVQTVACTWFLFSVGLTSADLYRLFFK